MVKKFSTVSFDAAELAVRIIEANCEVLRPEGLSAREVLDVTKDEPRDAALRCAEAAIQYFVERMSDSTGMEIQNVRVCPGDAGNA